MRKWGTFGPFVTEGRWPTVEQLEPFFLAPAGHEWSYDGGSDGWALNAEGTYGTEHLPEESRVNVHLRMIGNPHHGVYLQHAKWDGRIGSRHSLYAKGNLSRLREYVWSLHGTPLSVGLFVSFATAWRAVREYIETEGELASRYRVGRERRASPVRIS